MLKKKVRMNPFPIDKFIEIVDEYYSLSDAPVVKFLAKNTGDPFKILISTILSLRTKDEITSLAVKRLFRTIITPDDIVLCGASRIEKMVYPVGFYRKKSRQIVEICCILLDEYGGHVPNNIGELLSLPGVGRKTANLVLSEAFDVPSICVDVHVHRISNRLGYVKTDHPHRTESVLRRQLPKKYWASYNRLLVSFGQSICRPLSPFCSKCPIFFMCNRVGVDKFR